MWVGVNFYWNIYTATLDPELNFRDHCRWLCVSTSVGSAQSHLLFLVIFKKPYLYESLKFATIAINLHYVLFHSLLDRKLLCRCFCFDKSLENHVLKFGICRVILRRTVFHLWRAKDGFRNTWRTVYKWVSNWPRVWNKRGDWKFSE